MPTRKTKKTKVSEEPALKKDASATYNAFKEFEGRHYTGMKVGRGHKWNYDPGVWKETKVSPDEWQVEFTVTKRRKGHAPEGSGVPVGTEYHWYILAHQNVTKLNANDYSTSLTGMKFKLAHKRADKETWSASTNAQRKAIIKILKEVATRLEREQQEAEKEAAKVTPIGKGRKAKKGSGSVEAPRKGARMHPRVAAARRRG